MRHVVIAIALLAVGCKKSGGTTTPEGGDGGGGGRAKRITLAWGLQHGGSSADVFLQTTDERGHQVSHPLGKFDGACNELKPVPPTLAGSVMSLACKAGPTGWQLDAVPRNGRVIVMKLRIDDGVQPDPMSATQLAEIAVPPDAAIGTP